MFPKITEFNLPDFLHGFLPEQISIYSYGVMIALGVLVSFYVALRKVSKFGIDPDQLSNLFIFVILAAFVGGKLFYFMEDTERYANDPSQLLNIKGGGFVFYGSLIFAVPTIVWWLKRKTIPVRPFLDVLAFVGPIVHSFGRVGCFLAGCCYGKTCDNVLGVTYTHADSLAKPLHTALYPTQLFDIAVNLVILLVVVLMERKKAFEGQLFLFYLMAYAVGRSIVEIYRGDEARGFVFGGLLSHSQFIALLIIACCLWFWRKWKKA